MYKIWRIIFTALWGVDPIRNMLSMGPTSISDLSTE